MGEGGRDPGGELSVNTAVLALQIGLILLSVDQCGLGFGMPHQGLQFVQGHTSPEAAGRERVPELVRVNVLPAALGDLRDLVFNGFDAKTMMRGPDGHKQGLVIIFPGFKVLPQGQFRFSIEEHGPTLVSLSVPDDHRSQLPVNVRLIDVAALADADPRREEKIHQGLLPDRLAGPAKLLELVGGQGCALRRLVFDAVNARTGIADNVLIGDQPRKERAQDPADVVEICVGGVPLALAIIQVHPDVIGPDV